MLGHAGMWAAAPWLDTVAAEKLFRHKVLKRLRAEGLIAEDRIELLARRAHGDSRVASGRPYAALPPLQSSCALPSNPRRRPRAAAVGTLDLDINGNTTNPVSHGGSNPRIEHRYLYQYFVVVQTTADASAKLPYQFRITYYESGPAFASYYDYSTIELRPMALESFSSSPVICAPEYVLFVDFENGSTSHLTTTVGG